VGQRRRERNEEIEGKGKNGEERGPFMDKVEGRSWRSLGCEVRCFTEKGDFYFWMRFCQ